MARRKEHDRYCPQAKWSRDDAIEWWDGCQTDFDCRCDLIAQIRADERRWVTESAGKELLNHKVTDGMCACGMHAPDAIEHLAWIVSVYVHDDLKPEYEEQS